MTIQALLELVERWQTADRSQWRGEDRVVYYAALRELSTMDVVALRRECQLHAERLRTAAHFAADFLSPVNRGTR
jgi:hypothetical protein